MGIAERIVLFVYHVLKAIANYICTRRWKKQKTYLQGHNEHSEDDEHASDALIDDILSARWIESERQQKIRQKTADWIHLIPDLFRRAQILVVQFVDKRIVDNLLAVQRNPAFKFFDAVTLTHVDTVKSHSCSQA